MPTKGAARDASLDDDLLRPVLDESYDADAFGRPWNPWNLPLSAVFGGPIASGILLAWNAHRLGSRRGVIVCSIAFLGIVVAFATAFALIENKDKSLVALANISALACSFFFVSAQSKRFRVYEGNGGEPGKLLLPFIGAVLIGLFLWVSLLRALGVPWDEL